MNKSADRIAILEKIEQYELEGRFDEDVEADPPTIPLKAGQVDYLNVKFTSKLKTLFANIVAKLYFDYKIFKKELIIKEVCGIENYLRVKDGGVILTANHFNPFDNYAIDITLQPHLKLKRLWKIIREGNYTSFPGLYGMLFRNCNTIPLSSSLAVWREMDVAVSRLLKRKEKLLIYPEQAMWWNYKKPRPLKPGAFNFAAKNNVPVLPVFITMEDSERIGIDGFPIQKYTINFCEPIYPKVELSQKENMKYLANKNFISWKNVYEEFYGLKLSYSCEEENEIISYNNCNC